MVNVGEPKVLYEDSSLIAIDKPAGMPAVSLHKGERDTLAAWIIKRFPDQKNIEKGSLEAGLINRLDNDTSGLIVAARSQDAYEHLRTEVTEGSVIKEYIALVLGKAPTNDTICDSIAHHPRKKKKMLVCDDERKAQELKARHAKTSFKTIGHYAFDEQSSYSLLLVSISTGVRHQIRAHLAKEGYPLAGDILYQNPKKRSADKIGMNRHFLHSFRLHLIHPSSESSLSLKSPLSADLIEVLHRLKPLRTFR